VSTSRTENDLDLTLEAVAVERQRKAKGRAVKGTSETLGHRAVK
jgi:hypothetical protein